MISKKFKALFLSTLLVIPMLLAAEEPSVEIKEQVELSYVQLYDKISQDLSITPSLEMFRIPNSACPSLKSSQRKKHSTFRKGIQRSLFSTCLQTPSTVSQAFRDYFRAGTALIRTNGSPLVYQELGVRAAAIWKSFGFSERDFTYLSQGFYLNKAPTSLETFFSSIRSLEKNVAKRNSLIENLLSFPPRQEWMSASVDGKELLYLPLEAVPTGDEALFTLVTPWATSKTYPISEETLALLFPEVIDWLSIENPEETLQFLLFLPVSSPTASSLPLLLNYWPKALAEEEEYLLEEVPLIVLEEFPLYHASSEPSEQHPSQQLTSADTRQKSKQTLRFSWPDSNYTEETSSNRDLDVRQSRGSFRASPNPILEVSWVYASKIVSKFLLA